MANRGYTDWKPKPETLYWISKVQDVLTEYEEYLPISLRQVFYRLVAEHGFEKTEKAYNRLGTWVARARRAQMLPFDSFVDGQGRAHAVQDYEDVADFWELVKKRSRGYRRERMKGQPVRIEVWSEAGMTDLLARVAWDYGIPVYSSRGFASVTNSHSVAERALDARVPTVLLHIGDYDPSGESIFEALTEDALTFLLQEHASMLRDLQDEETALDYIKRAQAGTLDYNEPDLLPVRVALTWEQVEEYEIETAPPKPSDSRSAKWIGETAQAEAIPPDLMQTIVRDAIEDRLDMDRYEEEMSLEEADQESIDATLDEITAD